MEGLVSRPLRSRWRVRCVSYPDSAASAHDERLFPRGVSSSFSLPPRNPVLLRSLLRTGPSRGCDLTGLCWRASGRAAGKAPSVAVRDAVSGQKRGPVRRGLRCSPFHSSRATRRGAARRGRCRFWLERHSCELGGSHGRTAARDARWATLRDLGAPLLFLRFVLPLSASSPSSRIARPPRSRQRPHRVHPRSRIEDVSRRSTRLTEMCESSGPCSSILIPLLARTRHRNSPTLRSLAPPSSRRLEPCRRRVRSPARTAPCPAPTSESIPRSFAPSPTLAPPCPPRRERSSFGTVAGSLGKSPCRYGRKPGRVWRGTAL